MCLGSRGVHKSEADELPGRVPVLPASWLRTGVANYLSGAGYLERDGPFFLFIATGFQDSVS